MGETRFGRPLVLRLDAPERQSLIRVLMDEIEVKSRELAEAETVWQEHVEHVRRCRNMLERLCG